MRSLLLRSALLTTFVALALYGCSGDGDPAQPAPQTGGSAGVGGTGATGGAGGTGGDGGTGGGGGTVPDGSTGGTGGTGLPDGSTDDGDAACQHTMVTATPAPAELFVMADRSGSMSGDKWTNLQQGLQDFFNLPASQGTYVALSFFPLDDGCAPSEGTCAGGAYVKPLVGWGELPANATALNAAVQAATSNGCFTPTQEALNGLLLGSKDRQVQMPGHQVAAVFLSDGEPCCGDCPCEDNTCIGGLVTPFAQGTPAIQTYAIYLDSAAKGVMDSIALAGGTNVAYDGGGGATTIVAAFEDIKSRMVHCKFSLPEVGGVPADPATLGVLLDLGSTAPSLLTPVGGPTECDPSGGWYLDNPANPGSVVLCPNWCQLFETTVGATVEFDVGCGSGGTGGSGGSGGTGGTGGAGGTAGAGGTGGTGGGANCGTAVDLCPGEAIPLAGTGINPRIGSATGDTSGLCHDASGTCSASGTGRDAVFSFQSDVEGTAQVTLTGDAVGVWDAVLYARSTCGDAASELDCSDAFNQFTQGGETLSFPVAASSSTFLFVDGYSGGAGTFGIDVAVIPKRCGNGLVESPEACDDGNTNETDFCKNDCTINPNPAGGVCPGMTITLAGTGLQDRTASVSGDTTNMGPDYSSKGCASTSTAASPDMVFAITPDVTGTMTLDLGGATATPWDAVLYVRTTCTNVDSELECDDSYSDGGEVISIPVVAGTTYYVVLDGYGSTATGGQFTMNVLVKQAYCSNSTVEGTEECDDGNTTSGDGCDSTCHFESKGPADLCPGLALTLIQSGVSWIAGVSGSTAGMTPAYAGTCGSSSNAPDHVYHFTTPVAGTVSVSLPTSGTPFDTVLYVRSGACSGPGAVQVQCDDNTGNGGEVITFKAAANVEHWIFVDGYSSNSGNYQLEVSVTPSCGDGVADPGETCDDGNLTAGDGCDLACLPEAACSTVATTETDSPTLPAIIPAACGTWLMPAGSIGAGDADYFSFAAVQGARIDARAFVGTPGSCPVGNAVVMSLWKDAAATAVPNNLGCSSQTGALLCGDTPAGGNCSTFSYVVPAGAGGTYQVKAHSRDVGSSIASYGLIVTVH